MFRRVSWISSKVKNVKSNFLANVYTECKHCEGENDLFSSYLGTRVLTFIRILHAYFDVISLKLISFAHIMNIKYIQIYVFFPLEQTVSIFAFVHVFMRVCVLVFACSCTNRYKRIFIYIYIYIYIWPVIFSSSSSAFNNFWLLSNRRTRHRCYLRTNWDPEMSLVSPFKDTKI